MPKDTWEEGTKYKQDARDRKEVSYDKGTWEKRKRDRASTESDKRRFRERIDYSFKDWNKSDWKEIKTLRDMRMALDMKRDENNVPTLGNRATLDQSRLTWEHVKGYTHHKLPDGSLIYETKRYGTVARSRVLNDGKLYRKGQFLPKKYIEKRG